MVPITAILFFILAINVFWLSVISFILYKGYSTYKQLTQDIDQKDFAQVLKQIKQQIKDTDKDLSLVEKIIEDLEVRLKSHIQKIGFIRYNPFGNTGGDQSFCFCFLDENNNGILVTSLHTRDQTRVYAKPIQDGTSKEKLEFSKEEQACIKQALKWSK